jgi:hypothetical protein
MKEAIAKKTGDNEYTTVFVNDETIVKKRSKYIAGKNRHSGKTYTRFQEKDAVIFSWKRNNRLRIYTVSNLLLMGDTPKRKVRLVRDNTTHILKYPEHWVKEANEGFQRKFGRGAESVFKTEYPMLAFAEPARGLTPHLVAKDAADLTLRLYGAPRFRKDLVRTVGGVLEYAPNDRTTVALLAGRMFSGLVPTDWMVPWIARAAREAGTASPDILALPEARRTIRTASEKQLRRLMTTDGSLHGFHDSITMFRTLRGYNPDLMLSDLTFGSFRELHDVLAREQRKAKNPRFEIEYTGPAAELAGEYGEYRIVAPADSWTVDEWGDLMSNCIAGYSRAAKTQSTLLYGVYKGSELVANMELKPNGDVKQLLGKFNRGVDAEIQDTVYDAILSVWPYANVSGGWQGTVHNPRPVAQAPVRDLIREGVVDRPYFDGEMAGLFQWQGAPAQPARQVEFF